MNNNIFKIVFSSIFATLAIFTFVLLSEPTETGPIKIGVLTPLSGDAAIYGESLKKGMDLAVEKANVEGVLGRKVELMYEDTHLDSKTAVSAFNKFVDINKLSLVIVAEGSGATSAVVPLADKTQTLVIIPIASVDSLKDAGDYVFRIIPSDNYRGEQMGRFVKELGYNQAAVLYVNDDYGIGIKNIFSNSFGNAGGQVSITEAFSSGSVDYRSQLTKIKQSNPTVLVVAARKEFPVIMKQKNELGIKSAIIASEMVDTSIIDFARADMDGILTLDFAPATDFVEFRNNFRTKYGIDAPLYSDYGYDSVGVLIDAVKKAKSTNSTKVKNALYNIDYKGATGIIKFDLLGEVTEKLLIPVVVEGGKFIESK